MLTFRREGEIVRLSPKGTPNHDPSMRLQGVQAATDIAFIPRESLHEVCMAAEDHPFRALSLRLQPSQATLLQSGQALPGPGLSPHVALQ